MGGPWRGRLSVKGRTFSDEAAGVVAGVQREIWGQGASQQKLLLSHPLGIPSSSSRMPLFLLTWHMTERFKKHRLWGQAELGTPPASIT